VDAISRPILILVALREEVRAIQPLLEGARPIPGEKGLVGGRLAEADVLLARSGVGTARAADVTRRLLERFRPRAILAAGFAGGLREDLRPGDVVAASSVAEDRPTDAAGDPVTRDAPAAILEVLGRAEATRPTLPPGNRLLVGRLVTVARPSKSPEEKLELRRRHRADAVDMESSAVAGAAAEAGIPWLCVRTILDEQACELPFDFGKVLGPDGEPATGKILAEAIRRPTRFVALAGLGARARRAAKSLRALVPACVLALQASPPAP
jgi:adenosylhomocysteine nucleosidase